MLEIKDLTKIYKPKKGVPVMALDHVSLKLRDKGMVFILGKSGSGKSTLLNLLGGLDSYDSGEIIIKGKSSKDFTQGDFDSYRNTYLGFIFQEYNILEEFTVGANIALAIELQGKKAKEDDINRIMEEVDLAGYGSRKPNELSGGQMQRVAIARALVKNPEIILADEPTGALDSKTGIQVFNTLKKLAKSKLVIVVSHDREFAEQYGDRVIEFSDGKIISDIEKSTSVTRTNLDGFNIIDESFIVLKKGYKLTHDDMDRINQYIEKTNEEVIISIDDATNDHIKKMAKIDEDGNREVFKSTDNQTIDMAIKEGNEFKLIKSKLPFKDSLKIGASGLRGKPIRLFLTIFLSMISFSLFGLADTMGSYDQVDTAVTSFIKSGTNNISFTKVVYEDRGDYWNHENMNQSEDDITYLNESLNLDFTPVYTGGDFYESLDIRQNFYTYGALGNSQYFTQCLSGYAEFSLSEINELGFNITGVMPEAYDEIAISSYIFEHFLTAGYSNEDNTIQIVAENLNSETDVIGKEIQIKDEIYTITAVIDTKLDSKRYESLKNLNEEDANFIDYFKAEEFSTVTRFGYHSLIFVKPGFINNKIESVDSVGILLHQIGDIRLMNKDQSYHDWIDYIAKISDLNVGDYFMFDSEQTQLSEGEILFNAGDAVNLLGIENLDVPQHLKPYENETYTYTYGDLFYVKVHDAIFEYANNHYNEAFINGFTLEDAGINMDEASATDEDKKSAYFSYLQYSDGYSDNKFGQSGFDIEWQVKKEILLQNNLLINDVNNFEMMTSYRYSSENNTNGDVIVAGYFFPQSKMIDEYDSISLVVVEDGLYESFAKELPDPYGWVIAPMPKGEKAIKNIVEFSYDSGIENTKYNMQNEVYFILDQVNGFIENTATAFFYIGLGFAVFSSLLLFNFITTSIAHKKREIGVLRALGSRSSDVFGIFLNESLIIALINYILALALTIGAILYFNNYLRSEYGLLITFLNFGFRQIILMLFVSVGVATIASFLPVYKISHKKPIDAIRNR